MPGIEDLKGIAWPFRFENGSVAQSSGHQHVNESIQQVLLTRKGEYLMAPEFGCGIHDYVFDPVTYLPVAEELIVNALRLWVMGVEVVHTDLDLSRLGEGIVSWNLIYRIKGENEPLILNMRV